jgi:hypothetical protein
MVTLIFLGMGFAAYWSRGNLIPALLGIGTLILLLCAGRFRFSRNWFDVGRVVGDSIQIRQEVHYALTLIRWFALEGGRRNSVEELWSDLVFAAQRLGYSSVKMALADGQRAWEQSNGCHPTRSVVQVLQGGRLGTLELKAPSCEAGTGPVPGTQPCKLSFCPCVGGEKAFEIVSELLAEGWVKAVSTLQNGDRVSLRFDTRRSLPKNPSPRRFSIFTARGQSPQAVRKPAISPAEAVR